MENLETFISQNSQGLIQTYISERKKQNNIGALFINMDSNSDNVYYLDINCIADKYKNNTYNDLYFTNCENLLPLTNCWISGHTHDPFIGKINDCNVFVNPRGDPGEITHYDKNLVVESNIIIPAHL